MSNNANKLVGFQALDKLAKRIDDKIKVVETKANAAFKGVKVVNGNSVALYTTTDTTGTADYTIDLPAEKVVDSEKTEFVAHFNFVNGNYTGATNPNLDGEAVLVLAIKTIDKGVETTNYNFISVNSLVDIYTASDTSIAISDYKIAVNISAAENNALKLESDGLLVTCTTDSDVENILSTYFSSLNASDATIAITDTATTSANGLMSSADKAKLDGVAANAQVNVIESVKVNGTALTPASKAVNIDLSSYVAKDGSKVLSTNDFTTAEKNKLANVAENANNYSLPNATASTLGGVKIGSNISVDSGTISISKGNVTGALGYTPPTTNTTYSIVTTSANGLMSSADKAKLDYLYNNAVTGYQSDTYNISLMSAADNLVAVIPIAEPLDEEYFNIPPTTLSTTKTEMTIRKELSDTIVIKTEIAREKLPYHTLTWELIDTPNWVTLDSEDSFYTSDGTEYVQRILTVAPPSDANADLYNATVKLTGTYKAINDDDGSVYDETESNTLSISIVVDVPVVPPIPV